MRAPARRRPSTWLRALALGAAIATATAAGALAGPAPKKPGPVHGATFPARHEEYVALASDGSDAALEYLLSAYRRPGREETERARIVTLACDGFVGRDMTVPFRAWRERDATADDTWLWYRTLRRQVGTGSSEDAYAAAKDPKRPPSLRAAAIRALAAWADPGLLGLVADLAKSDLGKGPGRAVLVEALGVALASEPGRIGGPELRAAFDALIPFLEPGAVEPRTRLSLARSLARLFDLPRPTYDVRRFVARLDRTTAPPIEDPPIPGRPFFLDVEATGDHVVYVVDLSGSMSELLTDAERKNLQDRLARLAASLGGTGDVLPVLPLDRIRTRRDVAIEATKASIAVLPEDAWFGVVLFESAVRPFRGTTELLQATKPNVVATSKALDLEREGGATNLHGGLRRAFEALATRKGRAPGPAGDLEALARAPTTIFLLSDGAPCADDWGFAGTGLGAPLGTGDARGAPYVETVSLCDDVERMNLLRGCELHAIGIGEFSPGLLDRLAHVGHGTVRRLGVPLDRVAPAAQGKDGAPGPVEALPLTPADWLESLRAAKSTEARVDAVRHLGEAKYALALPDLLKLLATDFHDDVQEACVQALRAFAGRDFGWLPDLPVHEREALRRNWAWWGELHRALWESPK